MGNDLGIRIGVRSAEWENRDTQCGYVVGALSILSVSALQFPSNPGEFHSPMLKALPQKSVEPLSILHVEV